MLLSLLTSSFNSNYKSVSTSVASMHQKPVIIWLAHTCIYTGVLISPHNKCILALVPKIIGDHRIQVVFSTVYCDRRKWELDRKLLRIIVQHEMILLIMEQMDSSWYRQSCRGWSPTQLCKWSNRVAVLSLIARHKPRHSWYPQNSSCSASTADSYPNM